MVRLTYGSRRWFLGLVTLLLFLLLLLPAQTQGILLQFGGPLGHVLAWPLEAWSSLTTAVTDLWDGYVALRYVYEENQRLERETALLREQNNQLREAAAAGQRLAALLEFKERAGFDTVAARVIGKDATNWYQAVLLDKGESEGIQPEMGVMTPAGVVLLPRPAEGLSDQPVRAAHLPERADRHRGRRRRPVDPPDPHPHGGGHRQEHPRPAR